MDVKAWLPAAMRGSTAERKLATGQILFSPGDRAGLYEVVSRKVKRTRVDSERRELVLGISSAGDTFAEALFSSMHYCTAVAMTTTVVRFYQKAALFAEFARNPQAAQSLQSYSPTRWSICELAWNDKTFSRREIGFALSGRRRRERYFRPARWRQGPRRRTRPHARSVLSRTERAGEIVRCKAKIRLARALYDRVHI